MHRGVMPYLGIMLEDVYEPLKHHAHNNMLLLQQSTLKCDDKVV